jgi:hypothetical protein
VLGGAANKAGCGTSAKAVVLGSHMFRIAKHRYCYILRAIFAFALFDWFSMNDLIFCICYQIYRLEECNSVQGQKLSTQCFNKIDDRIVENLLTSVNGSNCSFLYQIAK